MIKRINIDKKEIIKKIGEGKKVLEINGVKKIGLFGSFVKGKENEKSDIDLLITLDSPDFERYANLLIFFEKLFKRKIDMVIESNLRKELNYVKKEAEYVRL